MTDPHGRPRLAASAKPEGVVAPDLMLMDSGAHIDSLVEGNTAFALDLYEKLKGQAGNLLVSPLSVSTVLAMVYLGARGRTASEMAQVLRFSPLRDRVAAQVASLQERLAVDGGTDGVRLRIANRLWGQTGYSFLEEFLQEVERSYRGGFQAVDFAQTADAVRLINRWAEAETEGLIKELLTPGTITELTRLVLANAIYFKGRWSVPFDKGATKVSRFSVSLRETVQVPMMRKVTSCGYLKAPALQVLEKRYGAGQFSMVLLLPEQIEGIAALEAALTPDDLCAWLSALQRVEVDLTVPKFRFENQFQLASALSAMGIVDLFQFPDADLTGLTENKNLFLSLVIHKAAIEVAEEGTKAAAATAATVMYGATLETKPRPIVFRADHPFLFLIRHNPSGSILFMGRVTNPQN